MIYICLIKYNIRVDPLNLSNSQNFSCCTDFTPKNNLASPCFLHANEGSVVLTWRANVFAVCLFVKIRLYFVSSVLMWPIRLFTMLGMFVSTPEIAAVFFCNFLLFEERFNPLTRKPLLVAPCQIEFIIIVQFLYFV